MVRAIFAALEGIAFTLKRICLVTDRVHAEFDDFGVEFSDGERAVLREEDFDLDEKGDAKASGMRLRAAPNMLFAVKMLFRLGGLDERIDRGDSGWNSYQQAIKVRDRLMHPRTVAALDVTDAEFEGVKEAMHWWIALWTKGQQAAGERIAGWMGALRQRGVWPPQR